METRSGETAKPKPPFPPQGITPPGVERRMQPRPLYKGSAYKAAGKLKEKVALITGGDSGIGRAVAYHFAAEGAKVAITYLEEEAADVEDLRADLDDLGVELLAVPGDVKDHAFCEEAVKEVLDRYGRLDILVNNAAFQKHVKEVAELDLDQWDLTFKTNIYGYFHMVRAALPHMADDGAIINTGSITGLEGSSGLLDYSATKGAIHAFTKSLAQMLIKRGIRVNCVAPGPVWTPLNPAERPEEDTKEFGAKTPLGRPAQPEEIAPLYVYFASNADSSYVTGEVTTLLGGMTRAG